MRRNTKHANILDALIAAFVCGIGLLALAGCEVEVNESPVEDAVEEIADE